MADDNGRPASDSGGDEPRSSLRLTTPVEVFSYVPYVPVTFDGNRIEVSTTPPDAGNPPPDVAPPEGTVLFQVKKPGEPDVYLAASPEVGHLWNPDTRKFDPPTAVQESGPSQKPKESAHPRVKMAYDLSRLLVPITADLVKAFLDDKHPAIDWIDWTTRGFTAAVGAKDVVDAVKKCFNSPDKMALLKAGVGVLNLTAATVSVAAGPAALTGNHPGAEKAVKAAGKIGTIGSAGSTGVDWYGEQHPQAERPKRSQDAETGQGVDPRPQANAATVLRQVAQEWPERRRSPSPSPRSGEDEPRLARTTSFAWPGGGSGGLPGGRPSPPERQNTGYMTSSLSSLPEGDEPRNLTRSDSSGSGPLEPISRRSSAATSAAPSIAAMARMDGLTGLTRRNTGAVGNQSSEPPSRHSPPGTAGSRTQSPKGAPRSK